MKVGLSFSRCVLDIVEGRINIDDVLVVISRTDFDPNDNEQWTNIWRGYTGTGSLNQSREWAHWLDAEDAEQRFRQVAIDLWNEGKLHQPRKFGAYPGRRSEYWLETVLPDSELERNPSVKAAWDYFQTLAGLAGTELDREYR